MPVDSRLSSRDLRLNSKIVLDSRSGETERFAAQELRSYLQRIDGRQWRSVSSNSAGTGNIYLKVRRRTARIRVPVHEEDESYTIDIRGDRVVLSGGSPRALLFAAYAFLEDLGCRWFAPSFDSYKNIGHETVPKLASITLPIGKRVVRPSMLYRDWSIEECRSHTIANTVSMIDWIAKVRGNVFCAPIDYQHSGRFTWDSVRSEIVPELRKRGLILAVGGHGYENFLPPDELFDAHPDWFAMINGKRSRNPHCVFETGNPAALRAFANRVADYVNAHPEIDILILQPPDLVRWGESKESMAQGSPSRRQGIVNHAVKRKLKRRESSVALETYAYDLSESYPENFDLHKDVIVTLALFYQTHRGPIYDPESMPEGRTPAALHNWAKNHRGTVSYLPYHRRYVWQSRPVVYPSVLWSDARYLHDRGIRGMVGFAEPGDWLTYELQHYLFARISENVSCDIAFVVEDYCRFRFGAAGELMARYFWLLERISLTAQKLGYDDKFPSPDALRHGKAMHADGEKLLRSARSTPRLSRQRKEHLTRLRAGFRTVALSFELMEAENREDLERTIDKYLRWVRRHRNMGLFVESFSLTNDRMRTLFGRALVGSVERKQIHHDMLKAL